MGCNDSRSRSKRMPVPIALLLEETRAKAAANSGLPIDGESWRRILGDRIAQHATPHACRGKVLTVLVASAVWAQELSLLSPDIVRRLQANGYGVSELRWQVQPLRQDTPPRTRQLPVTPLAQLPDELEIAIGRVADEELRRAISTAAAHVMGRQQSLRRPTASARPQGARVLQSAEPRTSQRDPSAAEPRAASLRTRAKPSG